MSSPKPAAQAANRIIVNITGLSGVTFAFEGRTVFIDFAMEPPRTNEKFPFEDTLVRVDHQQSTTTRDGSLIYPFQSVRGFFEGPTGPSRVVRISFNPKTRKVELLWQSPIASTSKVAISELTAALPGGSAVPVVVESEKVGEDDTVLREEMRQRRRARFQTQQRPVASQATSSRPKASGTTGSGSGSTNWRNNLRMKAGLQPLTPEQLLALEAPHGTLVTA